MKVLFYKYKNLVFSFTICLIISTVLFNYGDKFFGEILMSYMFPVFATMTLIAGLLLFVSVYGDVQLEKIMQEEPTEESLKEYEQWAGKIEIENQDLVFKYGEDQEIRIKISDIKVIGEFTTDAELDAVDWLLIIVKKDNEVIYLPAYAVGLQKVLGRLSKMLNHEIIPKLFSSVKFDSNVIYPQSIDGEKLFHFEGLNPVGFLRKIKVNMGFSPITPVLRNEIVEFKGGSKDIINDFGND